MTDEESIAGGRELIEASASPLDMLDRLAMVDYLRSQRALVARRGCCGKHEIWVSPMGAVLCKHTRDPCPRWKMALLLRWYSQLNEVKMETKELAVAGQSVEITPAGSKKQILALDNTLKSARHEIAAAEADGNDMLKALTLAKATQMVRDMLTPLMGDIMHLVGSPLGIKTDRDNQPENGRYGVEVIRDAVLGCLLRGARVVGNEINVIGGNGYLTKEYWERQFCEAPGVSHVQPPTLGIPRETKLGERAYALVQCRLDWQLNGKNDHLELTGDKSILVTWNARMGVDALHGKAKKRLYQMAYARVTGEMVDVDDDTTTIEAVAGSATTVPPAPSGPSSAVDDSPAAAENKQRIEDLLADVEGTLLSLDSILDCQKTGYHYKRALVEAQEKGVYTEAEAAGLVKVIAGLVDSRCNEIRKSRGQRRA